ncbi:MAG: lytic transglycosylase domain-containing protein, partial [Betaproteobacteria bacterium]
RRYCIHEHVVVEDGPWHELGTCWFNNLYARTIASDAIELTSAYLDRNVTATLKRLRIANATLHQKQDLAAVIHLCGAGTGNLYARRGFHLEAGQRCGDHDANGYIARVNTMKEVFRTLAEK